MQADQNQACRQYNLVCEERCCEIAAMFSFRRSTSAGPVGPCGSAAPAVKGAAGRQSGEWSGLKRVHIG